RVARGGRGAVHGRAGRQGQVARSGDGRVDDLDGRGRTGVHGDVGVGGRRRGGARGRREVDGAPDERGAPGQADRGGRRGGPDPERAAAGLGVRGRERDVASARVDRNGRVHHDGRAGAG